MLTLIVVFLYVKGCTFVVHYGKGIPLESCEQVLNLSGRLPFEHFKGVGGVCLSNGTKVENSSTASQSALVTRFLLSPQSL